MTRSVRPRTSRVAKVWRRACARDQRGLNLIESWNRVNTVIFFGKSGGFATIRRHVVPDRRHS